MIFRKVEFVIKSEFLFKLAGKAPSNNENQGVRIQCIQWINRDTRYNLQALQKRCVCGTLEQSNSEHSV